MHRGIFVSAVRRSVAMMAWTGLWAAGCGGVSGDRAETAGIRDDVEDTQGGLRDLESLADDDYSGGTPVSATVDARVALAKFPSIGVGLNVAAWDGNLSRVPKMFNLRLDPYERADITSNTYYDWLLDHAFLCVPAQDIIGEFLMTFKDYPPRQKAASFNLDEVMKKLQESQGK